MSQIDNVDQFNLLTPAKRISNATFLDVNPLPNPGSTELLIDAAAVLASIRNLIKSFNGTRGRIFTPDYFSGLYELLQEPFDDITSTKMSIALYQSLSKWEPRVTWVPADVSVSPNYLNVGYDISLNINIDGTLVNHTFLLPKS